MLIAGFIDKKGMFAANNNKVFPSFECASDVYRKSCIVQLFWYLITVKYRVFLELYYSCTMCLLKY